MSMVTKRSFCPAKVVLASAAVAASIVAIPAAAEAEAAPTTNIMIRTAAGSGVYCIDMSLWVGHKHIAYIYVTPGAAWKNTGIKVSKDGKSYDFKGYGVRGCNPSNSPLLRERFINAPVLSDPLTNWWVTI